MINEPVTHEHIRAFAATVRDGGVLTPNQREHLAGLLQSVGLAATLAPRAEQRLPDYAAAFGYLAAAWAPVERACAELLGASATHGD